MGQGGAREADGVDRLVGRRIAARRAAVGKSQSALAADLGISFQQIQKYEAGQNRVSASRLHRIALVLGAPVGDFFPEGGAEPDEAQAAPILTTEARAVLAAFERIRAAPVRKAVARIVVALAA